MAPSLAVIGLPDLAPALEAAGYRLLADSTDPPAVAAAARRAAGEGQAYVAIVAGDDPAVRAWASLQVTQGCRVLWLHSTALPLPDGPPAGTRALELPATLDEIMGAFGAPPAPGGAGEVLVDASGAPVAPAQSPQESPRDPWSAQGPTWGPPAPQSAPETPPEPPEPPGEPLGPVGRPGSGGGALIPGPWPRPQPPPTTVRQPERAPAPGSEALAYAPEPEEPPSPADAGEEGDLLLEEVFTAPPAPPQPPVLQPPPQPQPPAPRPTPSPAPPQPPAPPPVRRGGRLCPVVVVCAAKGGVGKSTLAISLAQRAATAGGIERVVVVDANRGQGDLRKYLRVGASRLPSVYDAALADDPRVAIVTPGRLNSERDQSLPEVGFAAALAPPRDQADPNVVTAEVYRRVVEVAREAAGLVVVDTQIVEASDTSGIIDGVVVPLLAGGGAWGLGVADDSRPGLDNLLGWISANAHRFGETRWLVAINRVSPTSPMSTELAERVVSRYGVLVGVAHEDPGVKASSAVAAAPTDPEVLAVIDEVLWRVVGTPAFDPAVRAPAAKERRSVFGRRRR